MNQNVLKVQKRLIELGYNPGPADGIRGRATIAAVMKFQADNKVEVDGMVGPVTFGLLFATPGGQPARPPQVNYDATPWMIEAYRVKGLHEGRNKSTLWSWLRSDGATVGDPTQVPWCGDFVQTSLALTMPMEPLPSNPYLASAWTSFGIPVTPQYGAVMSFWRESPTSWKGHVAYYVGETATHYKVLGGNQSNAVTETLLAKDRLRQNGARWPKTAMPPTGRKVAVDGSGLVVSTNEE